MKLVGCEGKKRYKREADTVQVIRFFEKMGKHETAYHCYWGNHWHITSMSRDQARREREKLKKSKGAKHLKELLEVARVKLYYSNQTEKL